MRSAVTSSISLGKEDGGLESDVRGLKSEVGKRQKSEVRGQTSEGRRQRGRYLGMIG